MSASAMIGYIQGNYIVLFRIRTSCYPRSAPGLRGKHGPSRCVRPLILAQSLTLSLNFNLVFLSTIRSSPCRIVVLLNIYAVLICATNSTINGHFYFRLSSPVIGIPT